MVLYGEIRTEGLSPDRRFTGRHDLIKYLLHDIWKSVLCTLCIHYFIFSSKQLWTFLLKYILLQHAIISRASCLTLWKTQWNGKTIICIFLKIFWGEKLLPKIIFPKLCYKCKKIVPNYVVKWYHPSTLHSMELKEMKNLCKSSRFIIDTAEILSLSYASRPFHHSAKI